MDVFTHGGEVFKASRELGLPKEKILDFSANINPLGFPSAVPDIIKRHIGDIVHYPDAGQEELILSAAKYFGVAPEFILPGNGSVELIHLLIEALRPKRAVIPAPTFSEYGHSCRPRGIHVDFIEIPPPEFKVDEGFLAKVAYRVEEGTLAVLCNPNNPTGQLVSPVELASFLKELEKKGAHLLLDEAFMDFVEDAYSMVDHLKSHENLIILRSLTKFFALPGLRIGFVLARPHLIEKLRTLKDPWNINTFAGAVTPRVLEDEDYIRKSREFIEREKQWLWKELGEIPGLSPLYPAANYIFVQIEGKVHADAMAERLKERGILIRRCDNYPFLDQRHFRVAVKDRRANTILVAAIREILGGNARE